MTSTRFSKSVIAALLAVSTINAYTFVPTKLATRQHSFVPTTTAATTASIHPSTTTSTTLFNSDGPTDQEIENAISKTKLSPEEVSEVGNLVADDEWMGLGMELSELVRVAIIEEVKKNTADFIGKEGKISKKKTNCKNI